jgi:2-dehydropantoate 2-reductase
MIEDNMKIAIIGTGGVGGYFGGMIAKAGYDVTFVARGENLKAINENGLTVKSVLGDFHLDSVKVTDKIQKIEQPALVIISVKAWQVKDVSAELKQVINKDSIVLPLQNGVLAIEELLENIDRANLIGGLCKIFCKLESPGVINHFGVVPTIVFGEVDNSRTERLDRIKEIFDRSSIKSVISDDINSDLWQKFIPICVGGLLAVTKTNYGELRELKETREMMVDILKENYQVSQKMGINIAPDFVDKTIAFIDTFPYDATSSLTRDVWEGKPSEIEYQNGTAVKLGKQYGVDTLVNRFVYNTILPMDLKARKKK